jgi:hypothetical protein
MIRKFLSVAIVALIITSCGNTGKKAAYSKSEGNSEAVKVEFASLVSNPSDYIGKNISVEGKVVHVCTHSGKKLFITGNNPDVMLYVQAGEEMPKFPMELLGSKIVVEGILTKATTIAMEEGKGMQEGEKMMEGASSDTCVTEKALVSQPVLSDLMMVYNKHTLVK